MSDPKYKIGDTLWRATFETEADYIPCPDCGTPRFMTIRLFDGTEHTVDCRTCERGYEGSRGYLQIHKRAPAVKSITIDRIEVEHDGSMKYNFADERDLFHDEASAMVRAQELADEASKTELDRISHREKDTKSWAWNATYHRREIARLTKEIEHHTAKLNVAAARAKEKAS